MNEATISLNHNIFGFIEQLYDLQNSEGKQMRNRTDKDKNSYLGRINDTLYIKEPSELQLTYNSGQLTQISIPEINLIAYGECDKAVVQDFRETLEHMWEFYGREDDCNLTEGAQKIKHWLLDNIEER